MSAYTGVIYSRELICMPDQKDNVRIGKQVMTPGFPVKFYVFTQAVDQLGSDAAQIGNNCLLKLCSTYPLLTKGSFAIANFWSLPEHNIQYGLDIFNYEFQGDWSTANPLIHGTTFENGEKNIPASCETMAIILGKEGELRRNTKSLEEYLSQWPDLGDLGPVKF